MAVVVIYSKIAKQDLRSIYDYIKKDSARYASNEILLIRQAINKLKSNILLGKKFEKSSDDLTRELIFRNYRIIYDIVPDERIIILTIHHHARLISNNPAFTDED
jgi:plasmid stabilization system protein ParE